LSKIFDINTNYQSIVIEYENVIRNNYKILVQKENNIKNKEEVIKQLEKRNQILRGKK
jgi:predicted choloylglycine hydrolase